MAAPARLVSRPSGKLGQIVFDETLPGFGIRIRAEGKRTCIASYDNSGG